jgi:hypothetical protein
MEKNFTNSLTKKTAGEDWNFYEETVAHDENLR